MSEHGERVRGSDASRDSKRKYEPPAILSQEVFETTALACGKRPAQGGACTGGGQKNS
jgi:hypothetical protein